MIRSTARLLAPALAAGLALTACGSGDGADGSGGPGASPGAQLPPPEVGAITQELDSSKLTLPVSAYLVPVAWLPDVDYATNILAARCMQNFGLTVPVQRKPLAPGVSGDTAGIATRYGITDRAQAASIGYGNPAAADASPSPTPASVVNTPGTPESLVYLGVDMRTWRPDQLKGDAADPASWPQIQYAGKDVPRGGCLLDARRQLGGAMPPFGVAQAVQNESYGRSEADSRVSAALGQWSACMKGKGFAYANPKEAGEKAAEATPGAKEKETAVAVADVDCKQQTNLIGIWFAVESAVQKQLIDANQQALDEDKKAADAYMKKVADVIKGQG